MAGSDLLHHFSEDPSIRLFKPHVPATNPTQRAAVWAIDANHAPLYWFPRECPRVTAWPHTIAQGRSFRTVLATTAKRLHAIEIGWLERMRTAKIYRYDFDPVAFSRWPEASGQWVSYRAVEPVAVSPAGDLLELHAKSGIELRLVPTLWPVVDLVNDDRWDFSIVRIANAVPRDAKS